MRVRRRHPPWNEDLALEPEATPAGAVRAMEPVFEQIAREEHARFLVQGRRDDGIVLSMEQWLER
ncbi:MAG TPA: hypothetical protein VES67_07890 [Vicinamibacterales bacterium]|nr:hypothetical protein [Vicinamibacterales bacterium]